MTPTWNWMPSRHRTRQAVLALAGLGVAVVVHAAPAVSAVPSSAPSGASSDVPLSAPAVAPGAKAPAPNTRGNADLVARGAYLATAGDCIACHTAAHGKPFAGGQWLATPVGPIVSTNITSSKADGIGRYTLAQFGAALRQGVRADGAHLYPAMPYTAYAKLSDADVEALYAYFQSGSVAPVDVAPATVTDLRFPFNIRLAMTFWNLLFLDRTPFAADASKSADWNRGAYLVQGLGHCSTCHTPRNVMMAEDTARPLAGAVVGGWYAPNISSDPDSGIGTWSAADIADYLRTGHASGRAQAAGPMAEAIDNSFRYLTPADLRAMALYLKSTPPVHDAADVRPADRWGAPGPGADAIRGMPLPAEPDRMSGAQLYDAYCATCHQARGEGVGAGGRAGAGLLADAGADVAQPGLPSLFHNTALGHGNSNNLVMVILQGARRQAGSVNGNGTVDGNGTVNGTRATASGANVSMPAFGALLDDAQIVTLGNYLLQQYGNPRSRVTAEQVRTLRANESTP